MNADLDMNSNDVLNAKSIATSALLIAGQSVTASTAVAGAFKNIQDNISTSITDTTLTVGDYVLTSDGQFWEVVAAGTYTANGTTVYDLTGISGQVVSKKTDFADYAELVGDTRTDSLFVADQEFTIGPLKIKYKKALSAATDNHVVTAGGVKLYLQPDSNGKYNALGMGAVADGADNFDGAMYGFNKDTRGPLTSWKWETGKAYAVGDIVEDVTNSKGLLCLVAHTSGTLATDEGAGNWATGAFTGTDNSAVMDACITSFHEQDQYVYWPSGKYYFGDGGTSETAAGGAKHNFSSCDKIFLHGEKGTEFLMDEDSTRLVTGGGGSYFIDTRQAVSPYTRVEHDRCEILNITFRGRWSHYAGGSSDDTNSIGWTPIRVEGFRYNSQSGCSFYDIRNKGTRNAHNNYAHHTDVYGERCARGVLREVNSSHVVFEDCSAKHTDDDPFDANVTDEVSADAMHTTVMRGIQVEDCESIICNNGHSVTIDGIISQRSKGSVLAVSRAGSSSPDSGRGPKTGISISNITAMDPLERYDFDTSDLSTTSITSGAIIIAGNKREGEDWSSGETVALGAVRRSTTDGQWYTADAAGTTAGDDTDLDGASDTGVNWTLDASYVWPNEWDSSANEIRAPWDSQTGTDSSSYLWNPRGDTEVQAHGMGVHLNKIQIMKTTGVLSNYSDMGHGYMFTRRGLKNPTITDSIRKGAGVALQFDLQDVSIDDVYVLGGDTAISFDASNSNRITSAFSNIKINNLVAVGQSTNCIYFEDPSETVTWNVTISNCTFDLDRYFRNTRRDNTNNDGSWDSVGNAVQTGVAVAKDHNILGVSLVHNSFANCLKTIHNGTGTNFTDHYALGNRLICEPTATDGYDADNKGIGYLPPAGLGWHYVPTSSDPSALDNNEIINVCLLSSDSIPTTGWYPKGHLVYDNDPASGTTTATGGVVRSAWLRLTDGSAHVLGTDWIEI
tara:strand:- start:2672 stop:5545 length:2874 start_codon:yes stop_codon:yes gene_type:complete